MSACTHAPVVNSDPESDAMPGWDQGGVPFSAGPWLGRTKSLAAVYLSAAPAVDDQLHQFRRCRTEAGNASDTKVIKLMHLVLFPSL